jgi:hypothetical protein
MSKFLFPVRRPLQACDMGPRGNRRSSPSPESKRAKLKGPTSFFYECSPVWPPGYPPWPSQPAQDHTRHHHTDGDVRHMLRAQVGQPNDAQSPRARTRVSVHGVHRERPVASRGTAHCVKGRRGAGWDTTCAAISRPSRPQLRVRNGSSCNTDTHFASMYGNALGHPVREDLHVTPWRAIIGSLH